VRNQLFSFLFLVPGRGGEALVVSGVVFFVSLRGRDFFFFFFEVILVLVFFVSGVSFFSILFFGGVGRGVAETLGSFWGQDGESRRSGYGERAGRRRRFGCRGKGEAAEAGDGRGGCG
jgi:hypothetical protein